MNVHISYKLHKTPDVEKEINHWIEKLQKRLQVFRPELVHLKGILEQNSPREGTTVSLNLRLPSGQMAVQQSAPAAVAAIKNAFGDLLQQITRHKELLRNSHKWRGRREPSTAAEPQEAFNKTFAAVQPPSVSRDDIRSYVNANLGRLERFVERELHFREDGDQLAIESVTKEEVIDETIVRALSDGDKPERLTLEPWLYRLAIHAINDLSFGDGQNGASIHLEESARTPNVRASDEPELQFHQPDETLTAESTIADRRVATPEEIVYTDEMITLVQFALAGSKRADREAFILHAIEGFTVEEIAAITDRGTNEVRSSITAAREHVRRVSPAATRFRDKLLHSTASNL